MSSAGHLRLLRYVGAFCDASICRASPMFSSAFPVPPTLVLAALESLCIVILVCMLYTLALTPQSIGGRSISPSRLALYIHDINSASRSWQGLFCRPPVHSFAHSLSLILTLFVPLRTPRTLDILRSLVLPSPPGTIICLHDSSLLLSSLHTCLLLTVCLSMCMDLTCSCH